MFRFEIKIKDRVSWKNKIKWSRGALIASSSSFGSSVRRGRMFSESASWNPLEPGFLSPPSVLTRVRSRSGGEAPPKLDPPRWNNPLLGRIQSSSHSSLDERKQQIELAAIRSSASSLLGGEKGRRNRILFRLFDRKKR